MTANQGTIQHFQETVDPSRSRVTRLPHRIWLFGGQIHENPLPPSSLRDAFNRACHQRSHDWIRDISLPEEYPDWLAYSGYDDLLLFERDAGFLSRAIVLFVESVGAFAELGAFSLDEQLHKKLFVVISRKFREGSLERSFINLGPLKRIESSRSDKKNLVPSICVIDAVQATDIKPIELDIIFQSLDDWLKSGDSTESFRNDNLSHRLLLLADLVDLLQILSERQAIEVLKHFGVEFDKDDIRRSAKLLNLMGLIRLSERGNEKYLVASNARSEPLLEYDAKQGRRFERLSFKAKTWTLLKSDPYLGPLLERVI